MYKKLIVLILFIFVIGASADSIPEGWQELLKNNPEDALLKFDEILKTDSQNVIALEGKAWASFSVGDWKGASSAWFTLLENKPDSSRSSVYLILIGEALKHYDFSDECINKIENLLNKGGLPSTLERSLHDMLRNLYRQKGDTEKVKSETEKAGYCRDFLYISGPYAKYGRTDLKTEFPPEFDSGKNAYSGWIGDVSSVKPVSPVDGVINIDDYLSPSSGVAYLATVVDVASATKAKLSVLSRNGIRVWCNGKMFIDKSSYNNDLYPPVTVPWEMNKGKNFILIKTQKETDDWQIAVQLFNEDGDKLEFTSPSVDIGILSNWIIDPDDISYIKEPIKSIEDEGKDNDSGIESFLDILYQGIKTGVDGYYNEAIDMLKKTDSVSGSWSVVHDFMGMMYKNEISRRTTSSHRLTNLYKNSFTKALELYPDDPVALDGLIKYHISRNTLDQALDLLNESNFIEEIENNPSKNPEIAFSLAKIYEMKNWNRKSINILQKLVEGEYLNADIIVELSGLYRQADAVDKSIEILRVGCNKYHNSRTLVSLLDMDLADLGKSKERIELLGNWLNLHGSDYRMRSRYGDALYLDGRHDDTFEEYNRIIKTNYQSPEGYLKLGEYFLDKANNASDESLLISMVLKGWEREYGWGEAPIDIEISNSQLVRVLHRAQYYFKKVSERDPTNKSVEYTLRQLNRILGFPTGNFWDSYDLDVMKIESDIFSDKDIAKANSIYLVDFMMTQVFSDGTAQSYIHQAVKILNEKGREKWAEVVIPGSADLISARSISPNGTVYLPTNKVNLRDGLAISMYGLEDGSIVDYSYVTNTGYTLSPGNNFITGSYYFGEENNPMVVSKLVLASPVELVFETNPIDFEPEITTSSKENVYTWEVIKSIPIESESNSPSMSKLVPTVSWSTVPDWDIALSKIKSYSMGRYEDSELLEDVITQIKSDIKPDDEMKQIVEKVYKYIQENIEPASESSSTTADTIYLGSGSAFEKTWLGKRIFEKLGIKTSLGWGYGWASPEMALSPPPQKSFFYQPLLKIETYGWLDLSNRYKTAGEIDSNLLTMFIPVETGYGLSFESVSSELIKSGWSRKELVGKITSSRDLVLDGTWTYQGPWVAGVRSLIADQMKRDTFIDSQVAGYLKNIVIRNKTVTDEPDLKEPVKLVFDGTLPEYVSESESIWKFNPLLIKSDMAGRIREASRTQPLVLNSSFAMDPYILKVYPPDGAENVPSIFGELPQNRVLLSPFGLFSLIYSREGSAVIVNRSLYIPDQTIQPEDYPKFVEFCRAIDSAETAELTLK